MKKTIKIFFSDFWANFDPENNLFTNLLREDYNVIISDQNPDFLFFSYFGNHFERFNCTRIYFTGENVTPNFKHCDFAMSFELDLDNPKHYRLPLYALFDDVAKLTTAKDPEAILKSKSQFCNFIYSNPNSKKRIDFFHKLSKYKTVHAGGRVLNNLGFRVDDKIKFISDYKFTIAFENESHPGYTTEKIFEPMIANSLPIYWGNPQVLRDFNTKSFLNYYDFSSDEELIEHIINVDNNDDLYLKYLEQPWFNNNQINEFVLNQNLKQFLHSIIDNQSTPVASQSPVFHSNPFVSKLSLACIDSAFHSKRLINKYIFNFNFNKIIYRLKNMKSRTQ